MPGLYDNNRIYALLLVFSHYVQVIYYDIYTPFAPFQMVHEKRFRQRSSIPVGRSGLKTKMVGNEYS